MSLTHYDTLTLTAPRSYEEALLGRLWQLGYDGLVDSGDDLHLAWQIFFAPDTHADHVRHCLAQCQAVSKEVRAEIITQPLKDWSEQWKQFFKPVQVSPTLHITTEGIPQALGPGQQQVVIVAGMAFGTGQHPTTQLIARALASDFPRRHWARVLDVGTGTGILGFVALAVGVARVDAMDIDPDALNCAEENVIKNNMIDKIFLSSTLENLTGPYPCIVANILLNPLIEMAPELVRRLSPAGDLYLSGILKDQIAPLSVAYTSCGLRFVASTTQEEWAMVHLQKSV